MASLTGKVTLTVALTDGAPWHDATNELPDDAGYYLCIYDVEEMGIMWFSGQPHGFDYVDVGFFPQFGSMNKCETVAYWMSMPKRPSADGALIVSGAELVQQIHDLREQVRVLGNEAAYRELINERDELRRRNEQLRAALASIGEQVKEGLSERWLKLN